MGKLRPRDSSHTAVLEAGWNNGLTSQPVLTGTPTGMLSPGFSRPLVGSVSL